MKISCTQENLNKGITNVSRIIGTRSTLPILSHILLSTEKGRLKLAGTDLEVAIITYIGAKVESEGTITLPARLFGEFVAANKDKIINLELDGTKVKASSDHVSAHLNGLVADDFPLIPEVKSDKSITINGEDFKKAISQVAFAASLDDSRPILTGVFIKAKGKELIMAATDSYRLAEVKLSLSEDVSEELSVVVPSKTMQEVGRLIEAGTKEITVNIDHNQISFAFDSVTVISRVLEGSYPDYEQIIPKDKTTTLEINSGQLQNALKLGSSFSRDSANNIKLVIKGESQVKVVATSPLVGDTVSEVDSNNSGEDLEISFNAKFLIDVLSNTPANEVKIDFSGNLAAAIINPKANQNYRALVMPLRLDE